VAEENFFHDLLLSLFYAMFRLLKVRISNNRQFFKEREKQSIYRSAKIDRELEMTNRSDFQLNDIFPSD
jgi:hypothetical protein